MTKQATLSIEGTNVRVKLRVYDTIEKMQKAHGAPGTDGLFITDKQGAKSVGTICLGADNLKAWAVVHECVHAAFAIGRTPGPFTWQESMHAEEEERLAYPTGEIAAAVLRKLNEWGMKVQV